MMGEHKRSRANRRLTVAVCIPTIPGREPELMRSEQSAVLQRRKPDQILVELDSGRTGAAATRNRLLARVTSDVIAWLDDDDWLSDIHIAACMRVLELDPSVDLVYPRPVMVGGEDPTATTRQGVFPVSPWGIRFGPEQEQHIRTRGSFIPMTHCVRTDFVRRTGGFPEGRTLDNGRYQGEDERYLINLLDAGARFEHLDRKTWRWNVNPRSTAGRGSVR
jgi:glycosyl transferase family 2